jgi:hypothetical protein
MKMPKVLVEAISPFLCLFRMEHTKNYVNGSKHARTGRANFFHTTTKNLAHAGNSKSVQPLQRLLKYSLLKLLLNLNNVNLSHKENQVNKLSF